MIRIRNERRWQQLVDEKLQNRILVGSFWPIAVACVISFGTLFLFGVRVKQEALAARIDFAALAPLFVATGILFVAAIVLQVILTMRLSHRIAGSAYRITKTLRAFRLGDRTERVSLRSGDFHGSLAGEVNEFLEWVTRETAALPSRRPGAAPASGVKAGTPTR